MIRCLHGLWTPNEAFFHWNPEFSSLGRQIGQINSGAFRGILGQTIRTNFGTVSPLSMLSNIQPLFLQETKPLFSHMTFYLNPLWDTGTGCALSIWNWIRFLHKHKQSQLHNKTIQIAFTHRLDSFVLFVFGFCLELVG